MTHRLVRWYGIKSKTATHVTLKWQEKHVPDPNKGWKRRQRKVTHSQLEKHYSRNPPNDRRP